MSHAAARRAAIPGGAGVRVGQDVPRTSAGARDPGFPARAYRVRRTWVGWMDKVEQKNTGGLTLVFDEQDSRA